MTNVVNRVRRLARRRDEGATAVEYGLLIALIAIVLAVGAAFLGNALNDRFSNACEQVAGEDGNCFAGD